MSSPSLDRRQLVILLGSGTTATIMGTTAGAASESDDDDDDDSEEVGDISGSVTDEDETPLEDVTVELFDDEDEPIAETTTDEDGEYELTEIETGTYEIEATKEDYETETAEVTVEADSTTEQSFELVADEQDQDEEEDEDETGTITGDVVDEDAAALEDVTIELFDGAEDEGEDELIAETTTDEDGAYELTEIEVGTYEIEAVKSDYEIGIDEVTVEADSTTELSFELVADGEDETGTITGEAVDEDATPLEDTAIEVIDGAEVIAETTTDEDGDYELTAVPTGTHDVEAIKSGYEIEIEEITVEADTTHDVSFMLAEEDADDDTGEEPEEPTASISVSHPSIPVGQEVAFTADGSEASTGTIETFSWEFGDGETDTGETVSHTYETPGEYTVELTVVTDQDELDTTSETVVVESPAQADDETTGDDGPSEVEVPGFGIGSAIASIGGAGYVIKRRLASDQKD